MYSKTLPFLIVALLFSSGSVFAFQNEPSQPDTTEIKQILQEAYLAEEEGNVEKAKRLANKGDSLSQLIDFKDGLAVATLRRGTLLGMEQKFESALSVLNSGIEKYPETPAIPDLYVAVGNIQRTLGNCEVSIRSFEQALLVSDFYVEAKREEFRAGVNMNIGGCLELLGDYAGAIEKHLAALEYAQNNADTSLMALSQMNIGNVYEEQRDIERAGYYYERAIENATSINMGRVLPGLYNNLALIRDQQERFEEAEALYLNAIKTQREMSNGTPFVQSIHNLGTLYRKMGEYDKAEEYLHRGLSLSTQMNIMVGLYYGNIELGYLFQAREIYETSIQYFERAKQIASDLNNDTFLSEVNEDLYKVYKDAGNAELALYHHERFKLLSDSLNQVQQDNELANLESQLELNRQTEINRLLEEKQAQQEARIQFQMILIVAGGVILLLIGVLLYTTRKSSKEKEQLLEKVRAQKGELEEMNKSKDQVFAMVAHDMRSPLTSVQGVIELIRDNVLEGEKLKNLVDNIEISIRENVNVIEDLLAWAKDQLSGFDLNLQNVELKPIAKDVLTTNSFMAIQKNITLESSFNGEAVYADPNALRVIMRNLISNAIKYSESGGKVQVEAEENGDNILLLVRDDGVGVPESSKDKIFNSNTWTRVGTSKEKGSGFGLNMSKEFVEKMGGKIWFESKEGEGTTFYVELPKPN